MIEIPRDKVAGLVEGASALSKATDTKSDSWLKFAREIFEAVPQAKAMWDDIKSNVAEARAENPHVPQVPTYEDTPTGKPKREVKVVDNYARAGNIFDELMKQGDKHKLVLSTMKGSTLLEMLKGKREEVVGKIAEELGK